MTGPEVGYGKTSWSTLNALEPIGTARTCGFVEQFLKGPSHSNLNLYSLQGDKAGRLHTIRARKERRIFLAKQGNVSVLLDAEHHDDMYNRPGRMQFVANPHTGFVDLVKPLSERAPVPEWFAPTLRMAPLVRWIIG
jgi:hypothetical protein